MRKTSGILACGLALAFGASLLSTSAFAAVHALGNLDPASAGSYSENDPSGGISAEGTFTLTLPALTALSATIAVNKKGMFTPGDLELWKGGVEIASAPLVFTGSQYTASFSEILAGGSYSEIITGTVNVKKLGIGGTVTTSAIPEPSTWAMMLMGFAGLGYAAFRRTGRNRAVGVV